MPQKSYRCTCKRCDHKFIAHEVPANCTECGLSTQVCKKI